MKNLVKTKGLHFKCYKSGNIRWYFGTGEFYYYKNFLLGYVANNYGAYFAEPLLYANIQEMFFRCFNVLLEVESVKIKRSEAIALLMLLEKYKETGFLYHELKTLLAL